MSSKIKKFIEFLWTDFKLQTQNIYTLQKRLYISYIYI